MTVFRHVVVFLHQFGANVFFGDPQFFLHPQFDRQAVRVPSALLHAMLRFEAANVLDGAGHHVVNAGLPLAEVVLEEDVGFVRGYGQC